MFLSYCITKSLIHQIKCDLIAQEKIFIVIVRSTFGEFAAIYQKICLLPDMDRQYRDFNSYDTSKAQKNLFCQYLLGG